MKSKTYDEFVEKFKPKKTTDDCMTLPAVYEAVKGWVCNKYGIDPENVVRPFWPGADYKSVEYKPEDVVVDNPPFSIVAKIIEFYLMEGVQFFLFAPSMSCFSQRKVWDKTNHIIIDGSIKYENGAIVQTSFVTNLGDGSIVAQTAPDLRRAVNAAMDDGKTRPPRYEYPAHIVTAAMLRKYCAYGIDFVIPKGECMRVSALDDQKTEGKAVYGCGVLVSDRIATERVAAERLAQERRLVRERQAKDETHVWELSERELEIIEAFSGKK